MDTANLVIASNRGPVSFRRQDDGTIAPQRGAGGLVSSLGPLVANTSALWVAAAMTDAEREAAAGGAVKAAGFHVRSIDVGEGTYRMAYNVVSNATLWFLYHHLYDLPRRPRMDHRWREAWAGYRAYNEAFAAALAEEAPDGATVLLQDYHLSLVAPSLRRRRPDLHTVHFHHTPFCEPSWLRVLPDGIAHELMEGLAANGACGFHTRRWEQAFRACCEEVLGSAPPTFVSPLAPAADDIRAVAASPACAAEGAHLDELIGDRSVIVRVDRIEPSKNILRGFFAYDELLESRPDLRGRVVFAAFCYPSREGLADYLAYHNEVETLAAQVNDRWGDADWTPVLLHTTDNFARSVAALQRYDVLLVNPVRDGMNLVALEGPVVNTRAGMVALSREAGAWETLGPLTLGVNPFDVTATAEALARGLEMGADERASASAALADTALSRTPADWLADQLGAAR